jgi:hypothetical protein
MYQLFPLFSGTVEVEVPEHTNALAYVPSNPNSATGGFTDCCRLVGAVCAYDLIAEEAGIVRRTIATLGATAREV